MSERIGGVKEITNCKNYGLITITDKWYGYSSAGGVAACLRENAFISDCINYGDVQGVECYHGGIVGSIGDNCVIANCFNYGNCDSGITYNVDINCKVLNCFNMGECQDGLVSSCGETNVYINNCYNLGNVSDTGILGKITNTSKEIILNIENCYNAGKSDKAIVGTIKNDSITTVNVKNTYYDPSKSNSVGVIQDGISTQSIKNNSSFVDTLNSNIDETNTDWKRWISYI